ncbi:hypothetical protein A2880_00040 [Candidatus Peribacteria bacterium RIFCSPHIGHO2_01_FULL_49_38]|nr:MAG: hypothetical protein A2880_00040 [Candidatus Peribacteria bacterium RIFCSPHIGHO2_01_FULL_49_38]
MPADQFIQFGLLIAAVIPIAWYIYKQLIYEKYFCLQLDADLRNRNGVYISDLIIGEKGETRVSEIAMWTRLHIFNKSSGRIAIMKFQGFEKGSKPRETRGLIVEKVTFPSDYETERVENALTLPIAIEPHSVLSCWALCTVKIPPALGTSLFSLYGKPSLDVETVRRVRYGRDDLQNQIYAAVQKDAPLLGIHIESVNVGDIQTSDPILCMEGSVPKFNPRFGRVSPFAGTDVLRQSFTKKGAHPAAIKISAKSYIVQAVLADGRSISKKFPIQETPLWFLKR